MYSLFIVLFVRLLNKDTENGRAEFQHLQFVRHQSSDALQKSYGFSAVEAARYQRLVYVLVNITKANELSYIGGIGIVILRTLLISFVQLDLVYVILISIPNAFSLFITAFFQINTISCFYLIFWFDCIFTKMYLKISSDELNSDSMIERTEGVWPLKVTSNSRPFVERTPPEKTNHEFSIEKVARRHLKLSKLAKRSVLRFNFILRLFHFVQNVSNFTVAFYFIGLILLDILVPYIILLADNDPLSLFMVIGLTVQTLLTAIYTVAHTNSYVIESVGTSCILFGSFENKNFP